jgi:hypothetical protein
MTEKLDIHNARGDAEKAVGSSPGETTRANSPSFAQEVVADSKKANQAQPTTVP